MMIKRLAHEVLKRLRRPVDRHFANSHPVGLAARMIDFAKPVIRYMHANDKWTLAVHAPEWMKVAHMPPIAPLPRPKRIFMMTAYRGQLSLDLPLAALLAWRGHQVTMGYFPKLGSPTKPPEVDHDSAEPYLDAALARVTTASGRKVHMVNLAPLVGQHEAEVDEKMIVQQSFSDAIMKLGRETIDPQNIRDAEILAYYQELGRRTQSAIHAFFRQQRDEFDLVLVANGATFESAHLCCVANQRGITFNTYEKFSFRHIRLMGHGSHFLKFTDLRSVWRRRAELGYTNPETKRAAITAAMRLIDERRNAGKNNWAWAYQSAPGQPASTALAASGLASGEPFVLVCPNVPFDAGYFEFTTVFPSMRSWLVETVKALLQMDTIKVVVRAHPAEVLHYGGTESAKSILDSAGLSSHPRLVLIPGGEKVNTYGLMEQCKFGAVFSSTTGLELAMLGKQVVVGADVYYGKCGFTLDADDAASYLDALRRLVANPAKELVNPHSDEAQLFHFMLHHVVQWPFPYDKPDDILRMPPHRLVASPELGRYLPTLDALTATRPEFDASMPEWLAASTCGHLPDLVPRAHIAKVASQIN